jgi:hypothetical protein
LSRAILFVLAFAVLLPACSGNEPPAFFGAMDAARVAVADVSPNRYNRFVRHSNEFIHRYCNVTEPPD